MKSPAYWSASCYDFFKTRVWGQTARIQREQQERVREWIPRGASVVEVAAGTGTFYSQTLAGHVGGYIALDLNPAFVRAMQQRGIDARLCDVRVDSLPAADIVVIYSSLYHFKAQHPAVFGKLLAAARDRLIIVEPLHQDRPPTWRSHLRARLADIGEGPIYDRFREEELRALAAANGCIEHFELLPGNTALCVVTGLRQGEGS